MEKYLLGKNPLGWTLDEHGWTWMKYTWSIDTTIIDNNCAMFERPNLAYGSYIDYSWLGVGWRWFENWHTLQEPNNSTGTYQVVLTSVSLGILSGILSCMYTALAFLPIRSLLTLTLFENPTNPWPPLQPRIRNLLDVTWPGTFRQMLGPMNQQMDNRSSCGLSTRFCWCKTMFSGYWLSMVHQLFINGSSMVHQWVTNRSSMIIDYQCFINR